MLQALDYYGVLFRLLDLPAGDGWLHSRKFRQFCLLKNALFLLLMCFVLYQLPWHGTVGQVLCKAVVLNTTSSTVSISRREQLF